MASVNHFLDEFFHARSVAVVGATNNPFKTNYRLIENLVNLDYDGRVHPINPKEKEIHGLKAYPRLRDVPGEIDLVVTAVRPALIMDVVRECDELGIKKLVIVTGGFSEAGEKGRKLQQEVADFVHARGIRTLGPNTLTPVNTAVNLAISFFELKKLRRGGVSFAFQSGFYEPKLNWIFSRLGVAKMLDMGNKIDINEVDALEYLAQDPETRVIAMHVESIRGDGRKFFKILNQVSWEKPTVILKTGHTSAGGRAAASHTGAMARENDAILDGLIRQTAAVRAHNLEEFFDLAKAFEMLDPPPGDRLAIITMSGGEGVMATDASEKYGLKLARLSEGTARRLKAASPLWEIPLNPFDGGVVVQFHLSDPPTFFDILTAIPEDENVDCAALQMPPNLFGAAFSEPDGSDENQSLIARQFMDRLLKMKKTGKSIAIWPNALDRYEQELIAVIESHDMPVFPSADRAVKCLAVLEKYRRRILRADN